MSTRLTITFEDGTQRVYDFDGEVIEFGRYRYAKKVVDADISALESCPDLKDLSLPANHLPQFDLTPLKSCTQLMKLSLGYSGDNLDDNCEGKHSIDLSPLRSCRNLVDLSILVLNLDKIDLSPLAYCKKLTRLRLSGNQLTHIDLSPLSSCSELEELIIELQRMESIDLTPISKCSKLELLEIKYTRLLRIDLSPLAANTKLRELNLEFNRLKTITFLPQDSKCGLRTIKLTHNSFARINLSFLSLFPDLESLSLDNNTRLRKVNLSPLRKCTNLQDLNLAGNNIQTVDLTPLSSCDNLRNVVIANNEIDQINLALLSSCRNLRELSLGGNRLSKINLKPLSSCTNLRSLGLSGDYLKSIDLSPLASCHALYSLDLTCNPIKKLDVTPLVLNPNLRILFCGESSLGDICRQDVSTEVTTWLRTPFPWSLPLRAREASLKPPAPVDSWKFLHKIASIPHALSIPIQSYVLKALGLEAYGLIDNDITDLLVSIPPRTKIDDAREKARQFVIEKICEQIDNGGTTIGIDVDNLVPDVPEIAQRLEQITKLRALEMENYVIRTEKWWAKTGRRMIQYNVFQLALTAYGFLIMKAIETNWGHAHFAGGLRIQVDKEVLAQIKDGIQKIGFDVQFQVVEEIIPLTPISFEPKNMSRQMMYYVLGLAGTGFSWVPTSSP